MQWYHLVSLFTDIALGGMAYHLALRLSRIQSKQTIILEALVKRVEALEQNHHPPTRLSADLSEVQPLR